MPKFALHERFASAAEGEVCGVCCKLTATFVGLHIAGPGTPSRYTRICRQCVDKMAATFPQAKEPRPIEEKAKLTAALAYHEAAEAEEEE